MPDQPNPPSSSFSRRSFLRGTALTAATAALAQKGLPEAFAADAPSNPAATGTVLSGEIPITLTLNGQPRQLSVEPRTTLLSALRDRLDPPLTGPKLVCNAGTCGACTVIVDGKAAYGCSLLAIDMVGKRITTVEGIGSPDQLSPVQQAFCDKDAMMCGFCTNGFVTAITAFLAKNPNPTPDQMREGIKGNFCRCGTYPHIFEATLAAAKALRTKGSPV